MQKQKLEIPIKDVVAVVLSATMKDWETFRGKLSHMEDVERIVLVVNQCTKFLDRAAKLYRVFDFIDAVYPDVSCDLSRGRHNVVSLLQIRLSAIISGEYSSLLKQFEAEDEQFSKYMEGAENTKELLAKEIQPVSITDNYDAGWIARDGTYYGTNGSYANMLHAALADASKYGKFCHKGMLLFGLTYTPCSMAKLEMMEPPMIAKLLDFGLL